MKQIYLAAITALFLIPAPLLAQEDIAVEAEATPLIQSAGDTELSSFKWQSRVIAVFADSTLDPSYNEQISLLESRPDALLERDVVVLTDTDPDLRSPLRTALRPRGFALVIVDKDGRVMLRKPDPWDVREITRAIDKTPLRQQEMESGR
ncbi:DUF4174 domain-containing protein [Celeribacter ethanolicus]|uniref:DUF4174 domain-containing protein n=1 Tax=Celeribacter ethanolicus TaxID=1758178 RepID=A0A291GH39_9RHOB|nr:DUF4174 domain-containing protein [Celeribacter ethanolicus]ATG49515.1 hypothetical protein CEW89_19220 [Celeribacter ethanolicus]